MLLLLQDRVVGFLLAEPPGIGVHLAELAVREDCRGRGFGGRLLREGLAALERGSRRKVSFFSLRVKPNAELCPIVSARPAQLVVCSEEGSLLSRGAVVVPAIYY